MGSLVKESGNDGSKTMTTTTTESGTESRESSSSSCSSSEDSSEEVKKRETCSPSLLGWPIRKAGVSKNSLVSDEMGRAEKIHFDDLTFKKPGSLISGWLFGFWVYLVAEKTLWEKKKFLFLSLNLVSFD